MHFDEKSGKVDKRGFTFRTVNTWRKYISSYIDDFHVYLDVSDLSIDDIELYWPSIDLAKERSNTGEWVRRGRPKGTKQSRISGLRGLTWQQLRKHIRENPQELNKLWNEYVSKFGGYDPVSRRRALNNFYKQITVHPDMLDLKLQTSY